MPIVVVHHLVWNAVQMQSYRAGYPRPFLSFSAVPEQILAIKSFTFDYSSHGHLKEGFKLINNLLDIVNCPSCYHHL